MEPIKCVEFTPRGCNLALDQCGKRLSKEKGYKDVIKHVDWICEMASDICEMHALRCKL